MNRMIKFTGPSGLPGLYDPSLDEISVGAIGPQGDIGDVGDRGNYGLNKLIIMIN